MTTEVCFHVFAPPQGNRPPREIFTCKRTVTPDDADHVASDVLDDAEQAMLKNPQTCPKCGKSHWLLIVEYPGEAHTGRRYRLFEFDHQPTKARLN